MAGEATVKLFDHTFSGNPNNPMFNFLQEMECYINSDAKKPAEMYKPPETFLGEIPSDRSCHYCGRRKMWLYTWSCCQKAILCGECHWHKLHLQQKCRGGTMTRCPSCKAYRRIDTPENLTKSLVPIVQKSATS